MDFYILKKSPHLGPFSITQLDKLLQEEEIDGEDLYWHEGMQSWVRLSQFAGYIPPPTAPPPPPDFIMRRPPPTAIIKPSRTEDAPTAKLRRDELVNKEDIKVSGERERAGVAEKEEPTREIEAARSDQGVGEGESARKEEDRPVVSDKLSNGTQSAMGRILANGGRKATLGLPPPGSKRAATTKLARVQKRPQHLLESAGQKPLQWVSIANVVGVAVALLVVGAAYSLAHTHPEKAAEKPRALPRTVASIGDAVRFASGTWTYTGTAAPGKTALWEKLVIRPNLTMDIYSTLATSRDWGTPAAGSFKIVTGKYADTGDRVYALQVAGYDMRIVITNRGTLRETSADRDVEFTRGDRFPFAR